MSPIARLAAIAALSGLAGFAGTSALLAKSPDRPAISANDGLTASLPIQVILIMQDAIAVRNEHARRPP